jgi:hypothetical protein
VAIFGLASDSNVSASRPLTVRHFERRTPPPNAIPITFVANLTQALEVPPTGSPGTGSTTVVLDTTANTMHVHVTFSGLTSGTTASHIHCCLASAFETGANVMAFPGFPLGVTSGTYDMTFDLLDAGTYNPTFITSAFDPSGTIAGPKRRWRRESRTGRPISTSSPRIFRAAKSAAS